MSGRLEVAAWPTGTRTALEIGIGVVIGTSLTRASLEQLQELWRPAILITVTLVMTGLVVGLWTSRLLGIDPVVALLGAAPGGISGMSLVGSRFRCGSGCSGPSCRTPDHRFARASGGGETAGAPGSE